MASTSSSSGSSGSSKGKKKESKALPAALEEMRSRVHVGQKGISHATNIEDPDAYASLGFDNAFSLEQFKNDFKMEIISSSANEMVFDMIGIDAPLANAFRRIMLSEVPSMAIDEIKLIQNTSIIQDEVLVHRLGLIPIRADPALFDYVAEHKGIKNEANSLTFTLQIKCIRNPKADAAAATSDQFINSTVYSSALKWYPITKRQKKKFEANPPAAALDDIIIAKLRPGQEIEAELYVEKGIGKTHAKWSPVATASYRLLPEIKFLKPVEGAEADVLVKKCPMGVFDIEEIAGGRGRRARVANPRSCTMCRECIREDNMNEKIALRRVRNHFIFNIETEGSGPPTPAAIFKESIGVLMKKCRTILAELDTASKAQAAAKSKRRAKAAAAASAAVEDEGEEPIEDAVDETDD